MIKNMIFLIVINFLNIGTFMTIDKKTFSINLYNSLVEGKDGILKAIGATLNIAFSIWQSKELKVVKELDVNGFSNNSELNEEATNYINAFAIDLINSGYQSVEKKKASQNIFNNIDEMKKEQPEMLRVLRDALPVAMFLIDSKCITQSASGKYFQGEGVKAKLNIAKNKFNQKMQDNFKMVDDVFSVSFSDLTKFSNWWYFKTLENPETKHSTHAVSDKYQETLSKKINDKTGKITATGEQWKHTIQSITKTIIKSLTQLDVENCFNEIDDVVLHIQGLSAYGSNNMVLGVRSDTEETIPVKLIGGVPFDYKSNKIVTRKIVEGGAVKIDTTQLNVMPHYTKAVAKQTVSKK